MLKLNENFAYFSSLHLVTLKVTERPIENKKQALLNKDELNTRINNEDDIGESEQEVQRLMVGHNTKYIEHLIDSSFHKYEAVVTFYADIPSRLIVAPGLEIEDIVALPIPRRRDAQHLKLESYQFIANDEEGVIDSGLKVVLDHYIQVSL